MHARPGIDAAVHTMTTDSSTQEPLLIGLAPTEPAAQLDRPHRHDRLTRPGSLMTGSGVLEV